MLLLLLSAVPAAGRGLLHAAAMLLQCISIRMRGHGAWACCLAGRRAQADEQFVTYYRYPSCK